MLLSPISFGFTELIYCVDVKKGGSSGSDEERSGIVIRRGRRRA